MRRFYTRFIAPLLGAGAVGVCPLCWAGSAAFLTYVGLAALIPIWNILVLILLGLGAVGMFLDIRYHRNAFPSVLYVAGGVLLYLGRYVYGGAGFGGWQIWIPGGILVVIAVFYNKRLFSNKRDALTYDELRISA